MTAGDRPTAGLAADDGEECRDRLDPKTEGGARHGIAAPRLQAARGGRFGRMFGFLAPGDPGMKAIEKLVDLLEPLHLSADPDPQNTIPAGFTYLGQFLDHDITFDPSSSLRRGSDPQALVNFRTPRFDLDSLYGSGPADQPFLYDWRDRKHPGVKLLVGCNTGEACYASVDLPRNAQGRALIGDARNDENLILAQLHLLFVRFHNKVVERLSEGAAKHATAQLFEEAQRIVRWHYQWIVTHDFLDRIVGTATARRVTPRLAFHDGGIIPVEFSGAVFRFGHSMVRPTYALNDDHLAVPIFAPRGSDPDEPHLGGFRRLPADHTIDWKLFFFDATRAPKLANFGMRINEKLAPALFHLPPDDASLPLLNLRRGRALGLPSGADVADAMGCKRLTEAQMFRFIAPDAQTRAALLRATPLWFYVLREASSLGDGGNHLGPVGGRIVAEVLIGLLEGDPQSYLRQSPTWKPHLGTTKGRFTMLDLLRFTLGPGKGGRKAELRVPSP